MPVVNQNVEVANPEIKDASTFTVYIKLPSNGDTIEITVTPNELVQELHQIVMEREETCHRTCFSLQLDSVILDNFVELKTIKGLKDGSVIKLVEEAYTVRHVKIHLRHTWELLQSTDMTDAFNGVDGASLSYVSTILSQESETRFVERFRDNEALVPDFLLPKNEAITSLPLKYMHPLSQKGSSVLCLKLLSFSHWNPPPGPRKLKGDLAYIHVVTLEEKPFDITACLRGFYVNQTSETFSFKPITEYGISHSLVDLLSKISPLFKRGFAQLLKQRNIQNGLERAPSPFYTNLWLAPLLEHTPDAMRSERAFNNRVAFEEIIPGQVRDWNEEMCSVKEMPKSTLEQRIARDRGIFKVSSDFTSAAIQGAQSVVDGNLMPINPGEEAKMHMFIWNNMFLSLGFDIRDHYKEVGGDFAAHVAPNNDLVGVKAYNDLDIDNLYTIGSVVVDYRGYRVTAQTIIPGILEKEQEQLVAYGYIDTSKKIITSQEYAELLQKPAKCLKISPHIVCSKASLQNDSDQSVSKEQEKCKDDEDKSASTEVLLFTSYESKGIIGNDKRHYLLDLLRTLPPDLNYLPLDNVALGETSKKYSFPKTYRHKLCILRPELVEAFIEFRYIMFIRSASNFIQDYTLKDGHKNSSGFIFDDEFTSEKSRNETEILSSNHLNGTECMANNCISEDTSVVFNKENRDPNNNCRNIEETDEKNMSKSIIQTACRLCGSIKDDEFDVRFNPDAFSPEIAYPDSQSIKLVRERQILIDACSFILSEQIPNLIKDWMELNLIPMDGKELVESMHQRGVNVRYLGHISMRVAETPSLHFIYQIVLTEILNRSTKHIFKSYMQGVSRSNLASAVAHFLNCLFSSCSVSPPQACNLPPEFNGSKSARKKNKRQSPISSYASESLDWKYLSPSALWSSVRGEALECYHFVINPSFATLNDFLYQHSISPLTLLRLFCLTCGIQLVLRNFLLGNGSRPAFLEDDVVNLFATVKSIVPKSNDSQALLLAGQRKIDQYFLKEGMELITQSLNLMNSTYGNLHSSIAFAFKLLARLSYITGDFVQALSHQHKATITTERIFGVDDNACITDYISLGIYSVACKYYDSGLNLFLRARYFLLLLHGNKHPFMALIDSNIGLVLYAMCNYSLAQVYLNNSLSIYTFYYGENSLKVAGCHHVLALCYFFSSEIRAAIKEERENLRIYKHQFGAEHEKVIESFKLIRQLTVHAVNLQKSIKAYQQGSKSHFSFTPEANRPSISTILSLINLLNDIVYISFNSHDFEKFKEGLERELKLNKHSLFFDHSEEDRSTLDKNKPVTNTNRSSISDIKDDIPLG